MDIVGNMPAVGHNVEKLFGSVFGMRSHKTDTVIPVNFVQAAQQGGKIHAFLQTFSIGIHILAKQRDFLITRFYQRTELLINLFRPPALLPPPYIRDNTIGAKIVASVHGCNPSPGFPISANRNALHDFLFLMSLKKNTFRID